MPIGGLRKFKSKAEAESYASRARAKGYFAGNPKKRGAYWVVSVLTKYGKNPLFVGKI